MSCDRGCGKIALEGSREESSITNEPGGEEFTEIRKNDSRIDKTADLAPDETASRATDILLSQKLWENIDNFVDVGEIPQCIKFLMCQSGFHTVLSFVESEENFVQDIEDYLQDEIDNIQTENASDEVFLQCLDDNNGNDSDAHHDASPELSDSQSDSDLDPRTSSESRETESEYVESIPGPLSVKCFDNVKTDSKSSYVKIRTRNCKKTSIVKKSTLCWLLRHEGKK